MQTRDSGSIGGMCMHNSVHITPSLIDFGVHAPFAARFPFAFDHISMEFHDNHIVGL